MSIYSIQVRKESISTSEIIDRLNRSEIKLMPNIITGDTIESFCGKAELNLNPNLIIGVRLDPSNNNSLLLLNGEFLSELPMKLLNYKTAWEVRKVEWCQVEFAILTEYTNHDQLMHFINLYKGTL